MEQRETTAPTESIRGLHDGGDAFVIAGAVAKGGFAGGALRALTSPEARLTLDVRRIVGTSSGALSAAYLAAGVRAGSFAYAATTLADLWINEATVRALDFSPRGLVSRSGLSTVDHLRALLAAQIRPLPQQHHRIELRVVAANMAGSLGWIAGQPATTFEHVFAFDGGVFDDEERLEDLYTAVCASSAVPGVFVPVEASIAGRVAPCLDGGAVNNAPLKHALGPARDVARVFVISPFPRVLDGVPNLQGVELAAHLGDVLISERLFRDLREAHSVNLALARLEAALHQPEHRAAALEALGWTGRRRVEIVEIRPPTPLPGGAFDGLLSHDLRLKYIAAGEQAAQAWLRSGRRESSPETG
jgi:predicted acylesterase/phospholipase RssA